MGESREPTGQERGRPLSQDPKGGCKPEGAAVRSEPPPAGRRGSRSRCRGSRRPPHAPLRSRVARLNRKPRPFKCPKPSLARSGRRVLVRALLLDLFPSSADRRRGGAAPLAPCRGTGHPPWRRGAVALGFLVLHVAIGIRPPQVLPEPFSGKERPVALTFPHSRCSAKARAFVHARLSSNKCFLNS